MLPLEGILFVPCLIVAPLVLIVFGFMRRRSGSYTAIWWFTFLACIILCIAFYLLALNTPLYSERDHSPSDPGGFSSSVSTGVGVFLVATCFFIPAYPVLFGLGFLTPRSWKTGVRLGTLVASLLFVLVLGTRLIQRNTVFNADYQQSKKQDALQGDRFEHLRVP